MSPPLPPGPVCARCPRLLGLSCCEVREGESLATLTRADVDRVSAHTGWAAARFVREEGLTEAEAAHYETLRPLYRGYFRRAPVRLTLVVRQGACLFLDRQRGCSLPSEARPLACRLYPFERWADGSWSVAVGRYGQLEEARAGGSACLAVEEAQSMEEVLAAFGTTHERVEALGAWLAEEAWAHGRSG